jgi:putative transposase
MRRRSKQLEIDFTSKRPGWGGKRKNAGRKPAAARKGFVAHVRRPALDGENHPVHITMRAVRGAPSLRTQRILRMIHACFARISRRAGPFRVLHFSVQADHIHLIVESWNARTLARTLQWLAAQIARRVNSDLSRSGSLWRDRYHRRDLTKPRQVRNTIVYVTMNIRKHSRVARLPLAALDPGSSAAWTDGWDARAGPAVAQVRTWLAERGLTTSPVTPAETWLARVGWKRHGLLRATELPSSAPP